MREEDTSDKQNMWAPFSCSGITFMCSKRRRTTPKSRRPEKNTSSTSAALLVCTAAAATDESQRRWPARLGVTPSSRGGGGGRVLTSHDGADRANEGDQLLFGAGLLAEAAQLVSAAD